MKSINIVFQYIDPTKGGIENTAYYLYKELEKTYEVKGCSMDVDDNYKLKGVKYYSTKNAGLKFFLLRNIWQYINSKNSDETVNLCMTWYNAIGAFFAKKKYGTPYYCLVHGDDVYFDCDTNNIVLKIKKIIGHMVLKNADCLCINSKNTRNILHKTVVNDNEVIIHPGIHFVEYDCTWKKKHDFIMISVGRHVERKGVRNVIKALPRLRRLIPNIKYVLVGEGPLTEEYKKLCEELKVADIVDFKGRVNEEEKYDLIKNSDLLIMPSFEIASEKTVEGFGIVFIEANMLGRYVVGTNCGGIPDAIKEGMTGHLLADSRPETITKDVWEIYNNIEAIYDTEMVKERIRWASSHSFNNIVKQYETVMNDNINNTIFWD